MINKLKSRKFWVAVTSAVLIIANEGLGLNLPQEAITGVVAIVISYILGQSYVDSKAQKAPVVTVTQ